MNVSREINIEPGAEYDGRGDGILFDNVVTVHVVREGSEDALLPVAASNDERLTDGRRDTLVPLVLMESTDYRGTFPRIVLDRPHKISRVEFDWYGPLGQSEEVEFAIRTDHLTKKVTLHELPKSIAISGYFEHSYVQLSAESKGDAGLFLSGIRVYGPTSVRQRHIYRDDELEVKSSGGWDPATGANRMAYLIVKNKLGQPVKIHVVVASTGITQLRNFRPDGE